MMRGVGLIQLVRRIPPMVDCPIWCPRRGSSPWIRRYPEVRFSFANRITSWRISLLTGGRAGRFG
jgi:hypothetical protein